MDTFNKFRKYFQKKKLLQNSIFHILTVSNHKNEITKLSWSMILIFDNNIFPIYLI